ncbi:mannonate dehydratase [Acidiphilium sp.]|uniref:mannonate dehydratase n=1 Tax=Acidiphilium sp. TaxID=527 RepID=UPI002584FD8A|nr:mannonate dehydratase [Acidiphilium sp.]
MEETWRWFGPEDPIPLEHVRQAGATGVVTALHDIPPGEPWPVAAVQARRDAIEAAGLRWSVCESIPVPTGIKCRDHDWPRLVAVWKDSLAAVARAGVGVICYNFMPVIDWTRTELAHEMPDGAKALRFDMVDFIGYDVFVLRRAGAASCYPAPLVAQAEARMAACDAAALARLERTIIAGLPGGAAAQTRETIAAEIARFDGLDDAAVRANLVDFLREVVPVAEELGVRLAIHPDDPPVKLFGLPRVVSTLEDLATLFEAVPSRANGLTLCAGSLGSRADNDVLAIAETFRSRIHFAHLRNVTVEPDGSFVEAPHLGGRTDMVALLALLLREEREAAAAGRRASIPLRPDHGHLLAADAARRVNPGYSYIGRLRGLAELRGVIRALEALAPAA